MFNLVDDHDEQFAFGLETWMAILDPYLVLKMRMVALDLFLVLKMLCRSFILLI